ncbi:MAG: MBOAT family protein [Elusimicrobia bacterium]|nr:MBOAT family protein [Elusimicrobiota bacterium]
MLFNSLEFFLFFVAVTGLFFILPHRFRWILLLSSSCVFYLFFIPIYIFILIFTIVIDYGVGLGLENIQDKKRKKLFLICSILANLGVLGFFKYYNFFMDNLAVVTQFLHLQNQISHLSIILPIGLSFHTFQAMAYTIEVYRGNQKAERHFGIYALYIMFYPQLVAGPIERPQNLIHQFYEEKTFDGDRVLSGLRLMLWGLFKKLVVADLLSIYVNAVYNNVTAYQGWPLIWATVFFSFQVYCDFSGYSDIAIGSARVMGFNLMQNFRSPYLSRSIKEFWTRWHISLSTWLRDYLFLPLAYWLSDKMKKDAYLGLKADKWIYILATGVTFLLCGLWHGANWTYVVWGALHGGYLVFGILVTGTKLDLFKKDSLLHGVIKVSLTMALVCFAWIFFRANNLADAMYIVKNLLRFGYSGYIGVPIFTVSGFAQCLAVLLTVAAVEMGLRFNPYESSTRPASSNVSFIVAVVMGIYMFGVLEKQAFIYFQF